MKPLLRILIGLASIIIILAGVKAASEIVGFVLIAVLLAVSITPAVTFLIRKKVKRNIALSIVIISLIVVGIFLIQQLGSSILELSNTLPSYEQRFQDLMVSADKFLERFDLDIDKVVKELNIDTRQIFQLTASILTTMGNYIGNGLFLLLIVCLMVVEFSSYETVFNRANLSSNNLYSKLYDIRQEIIKYVSITAFTGFIAALANLILLLILGVEFALIWGVLSFFLNFIPVLGVLIYTLLPSLMALLQFGITEALIVAVAFTIFNNVADNVIKPKLMKEGLKISLLSIFLSLYFWNWILGFSGAILAIPLTLAIKKAVSEISFEKDVI